MAGRRRASSTPKVGGGLRTGGGRGGRGWGEREAAPQGSGGRAGDGEGRWRSGDREGRREVDKGEREPVGEAWRRGLCGAECNREGGKGLGRGPLFGSAAP